MSALRVAGWAAAASVLWLAGCDNQKQQPGTSGGAYREVSAPTELIAVARPVISDLPVPIGFKLDEGRSRDYAAGNSRFVDHMYKGNADKFAVARFYQRHMPISRWVLMTKMFVQGGIMLTFQKETQFCRVTIADGSLFHPTHIKVQLWTTGRIEAQVAPGARGSSTK